MTDTPEKSPTLKQGVIFLIFAVALAMLAFYFVFTGIIPRSTAPVIDDSAYGPPAPLYRIVSFDALPDWRNDTVADALPAFLQSCARIDARAPDAPANSQENLGPGFEGWSLAGVVADWAPPCAAARALGRADNEDKDAWNAAVRAFFETHFQPVEVRESRAPLPDGPAKADAPLNTDRGVFTGYFEPAYEGRRDREAPFTAPVYSRPDDLVDVSLGAFRDDLAGERISGRLSGSRLVPYADHSEINAGALGDRAETIAWLDPNDLLFLQIQGSGRIELEDGAVLRVGYAGANGRRYTAIGRVLVQRGEMRVEEASMQSIRAWLKNASPTDAQTLREENQSYVFFRELPAPPQGFGPPGAQGAPLLPGRSLAVDRRFHPLGAPVFIDLEETPALGDGPIRKLMIAQDIGGAIRGPVRGDYFWGAGEDAAARAGVMNAQGRLFLLLPNARAEALAARLSSESAAQ